MEKGKLIKENLYTDKKLKRIKRGHLFNECMISGTLIVSTLILGACSKLCKKNPQTPINTPTATIMPTETVSPIETEEPIETTEPKETEEPMETTEPIETEEPIETDKPVEIEETREERAARINLENHLRKEMDGDYSQRTFFFIANINDIETALLIISMKDPYNNSLYADLFSRTPLFKIAREYTTLDDEFYIPIGILKDTKVENVRIANYYASTKGINYFLGTNITSVPPAKTIADAREVYNKIFSDYQRLEQLPYGPSLDYLMISLDEYNENYDGPTWEEQMEKQRESKIENVNTKEKVLVKKA